LISFFILKKVREANEQLLHSKLVREKFNGEIVSRLTGLKDKELGIFMSEFKRHCFKDFHKEVLRMNNENVEKMILEYFATINKN